MSARNRFAAKLLRRREREAHEPIMGPTPEGPNHYWRRAMKSRERWLLDIPYATSGRGRALHRDEKQRRRKALFSRLSTAMANGEPSERSEEGVSMLASSSMLASMTTTTRAREG